MNYADDRKESPVPFATPPRRLPSRWILGFAFSFRMGKVRKDFPDWVQAVKAALDVRTLQLHFPVPLLL